MNYLSVKNYDQFQHYKDRAPPWIKFYNSVLDDYDFTSLPDAARFHLVAIWLLASRTGNRIPNDEAWIRKAIKATTEIDLQALIAAGFLTACNLKANRKQRASKSLDQSREETEAEIETEKEAPTALSAKDELAKTLDSEHVDAVIEHRKKKGSALTPRAAKLLAARFAACPNPNAAADEMIVNGWQGFNPEWLANKKTGHDPPSFPSNKPPVGFRDARSTSEYVAYMREKLNDPKLEIGDSRLSRHQLVPADWHNPTPLRRVG